MSMATEQDRLKLSRTSKVPAEKSHLVSFGSKADSEGCPQLRPLWGVKQTSISGDWMSACSQEPTFAGSQNGCLTVRLGAVDGEQTSGQCQSGAGLFNPTRRAELLKDSERTLY